jgi:translation initiation factor 3 subunit D
LLLTLIVRCFSKFKTLAVQVPEDKDNINGVQQLSLEATMINQNLSQQLLAKGGDK